MIWTAPSVALQLELVLGICVSKCFGIRIFLFFSVTVNKAATEPGSDFVTINDVGAPLVPKVIDGETQLPLSYTMGTQVCLSFTTNSQCNPNDVGPCGFPSFPPGEAAADLELLAI